jgi:hypothetical protein
MMQTTRISFISVMMLAALGCKSNTDQPAKPGEGDKDNYDNNFVREVLALKTEDEREQFANKHDGHAVSLSGTVVDVRGTVRVFFVIETEETKAAGERGFDIFVAPSEKETLGFEANLEQGEATLRYANGRVVTLKKGQAVKLRAKVWEYNKGTQLEKKFLKGTLKISTAVFTD